MANIEGHLVGFESIPVDPNGEEFDYSLASYGVEDEEKEDQRSYSRMCAQTERARRRALIKKRQEVADQIKKAKTLDEKFVIAKKFHDVNGWFGMNSTALLHTPKMIQLTEEEYEFAQELHKQDPYKGICAEEKRINPYYMGRKFARLEFIRYSIELKALYQAYLNTTDSSHKESLLALIRNREGLILKKKNDLMGDNRRKKLANDFKMVRMERDILKSTLPTKTFIKKRREHLKNVLLKKHFSSHVR